MSGLAWSLVGYGLGWSGQVLIMVFAFPIKAGYGLGIGCMASSCAGHVLAMGFDDLAMTGHGLGWRVPGLTLGWAVLAMNWAVHGLGWPGHGLVVGLLAWQWA